MLLYDEAPGADTMTLRSEPIDRIIVHRIEVSQEDESFGDDPREIARFFREHPIGVKATGGSMPYPLVIERDGRITQTLPLDIASPHAKAYNQRAIGVACVGDFRTAAPSVAQYGALVSLCCDLLNRLHLDAEAIRGHDGLDGASSDPDKECPGRALSLPKLRSAVRSFVLQERLALRWERRAGE